MTRQGILVLYLAFVNLVLGRQIDISKMFPALKMSKQISSVKFKLKDHNMLNILQKLNISPGNNKASTAFMVKVFNVLHSGSSIVKAAGRGNLNQVDLALSDTIRSFAPKEFSPSLKRNRAEMVFRIPHLPHMERLRLAEIRCLRHSLVKVNVKKLKIKTRILKGESTVSKSAMRVKPVTDDNQVAYDITRALSPITNGYHGNITVHVNMPLKNSAHLANVWNDSGCYLVFYLENHNFIQNTVESYKNMFPHVGKKSSRQKRSTRDRNLRHKKSRRHNKNGKKNGCGLYDFDVNFNSIGWGQWIIHPTRFNAKVCDGKCSSPIDSRHKPTNHAILQSLMRTKHRNTAPAPCCVPTKLETLSMMYIEYGEIVVRHHDDMIASECGCR